MVKHAVFGLMAIWFIPAQLWTQTQGTVEFTVTTVSYGGKYAPKNIGAIWVADEQDRFVKTLKLWARKRKKHLIKWNAASGGNTVDAVTSATVKPHKTHTATWNGTDVTGAPVPDGVYKIYVEFTEDNSSKSGNPPGKWLLVTFTKGPSDQTVTPADQSYFKDIRLVYTAGGAVPQNASLSGTVTDTQTGKGIQDVLVQLLQGGQPAYQTRTGADGKYAFSDLAPGNYVLQATRSGYETFSTPVAVKGGDRLTQDIQLAPLDQPASLSGLVRDRETQQPITQATVRLTVSGQTAYVTRTGPDGRFAFQDIAAGTYELVVSRQGYGEWREQLTLNPGDRVAGKVIDLDKTSTAADTTPPLPPRNVRVRKLGN